MSKLPADERTHRVVPRLRADEVAYLERESSGVNLPRYVGLGKPGCPHLRVFHERGTTTDGGPWWSCEICKVSCHEDAEHYAERCAAYAAIERAGDRSIALAWWLFGLATGTIFGWVLT